MHMKLHYPVLVFRRSPVLEVWSREGYTVICTEERWAHIQSKHDAEITLEDLHDTINYPDAIYEHKKEPEKEIYIREYLDPDISEVVYAHASVFMPSDDDPVGRVASSWTGFNVSNDAGGVKWKRNK